MIIYEYVYTECHFILIHQNSKFNGGNDEMLNPPLPQNKYQYRYVFEGYLVLIYVSIIKKIIHYKLLVKQTYNPRKMFLIFYRIFFFFFFFFNCKQVGSLLAER